MVGKAVLIAAATAASAGSAMWVLGPAELGFGSSPSDNLRAVQRDPSWLDYLPSNDKQSRIEVASMTRESTGERDARRIDLLVKKDGSSIALCFATSRADLEGACPGSKVLGRMSRDVDEPWVGQVGTTSTDLLDLLRGPAPSLDQAASVLS